MRGVKLIMAMLVLPVIAKADEKADWKLLNGDWTVAKVTIQGQDQSALFKEAMLNMEDGKYTLSFGGTSDKGTIKIDTAAKPKTMDIEGVDGPNKGKKIPALYTIEGDKLTIAYTLSGTERPKDFESKEGSKQMVIEYSRKKK